MARGEMLKDNLSDRATSVKSLVKTEVGIVKDFVGDVVERFDLDEDVKPMMENRGVGGSIPGSAIDVVLDTYDNVVNFVQDNAKITRRWVTRR